MLTINVRLCLFIKGQSGYTAGIVWLNRKMAGGVQSQPNLSYMLQNFYFAISVA